MYFLQCLSSFRHYCTEAGVTSWQDSTIRWCGAKKPAGCTPMCCLSYCSSFIMSIRADTPVSSVSCHLPSCVPHGPLSGGRTDGCAVCSTGRNVCLVCALGIGHRLRATSVHDVRNHLLCSFGCPVLPVCKSHVRKDRHAQIPRMAGISRSISRQLS